MFAESAMYPSSSAVTSIFSTSPGSSTRPGDAMHDFVVHADAVEPGKVVGELRRRARAVLAKKRGADVVELFGGHPRLRGRAHLAERVRRRAFRRRACRRDRARIESSWLSIPRASSFLRTRALCCPPTRAAVILPSVLSASTSRMLGRPISNPCSTIQRSVPSKRGSRAAR